MGRAIDLFVTYRLLSYWSLRSRKRMRINLASLMKMVNVSWKLYKQTYHIKNYCRRMHTRFFTNSYSTSRRFLRRSLGCVPNLVHMQLPFLIERHVKRTSHGPEVFEKEFLKYRRMVTNWMIPSLKK